MANKHIAQKGKNAGQWVDCKAASPKTCKAGTGNQTPLHATDEELNGVAYHFKNKGRVSPFEVIKFRSLPKQEQQEAIKKAAQHQHLLKPTKPTPNTTPPKPVKEIKTPAPANLTEDGIKGFEAELQDIEKQNDVRAAEEWVYKRNPKALRLVTQTTGHAIKFRCKCGHVNQTNNAHTTPLTLNGKQYVKGSDALMARCENCSQHNIFPDASRQGILAVEY